MLERNKLAFCNEWKQRVCAFQAEMVRLKSPKVHVQVLLAKYVFMYHPWRIWER